MSPIERDLDKALTGRTEPDHETAPLVDVARRLEGMLDAEVAEAPRERALFAAAVGTRQRPSVWRYLAPAIAVTSLLAAVYFAGRAATPGNALYPVRKALQQVDLAPEVSDDVDGRLGQVRSNISEAVAIVDDEPVRARALATDALKTLGAIAELIDELPNDQQNARQADAALLERDAIAVLSLSLDEEEPEFVDQLEDRADDSGSGDGGDDSDDNSGSGGGDDNSGSGSGGDDTSGSSSGHDSSGSGSGDDN